MIDLDKIASFLRDYQLTLVKRTASGDNRSDPKIAEIEEQIVALVNLSVDLDDEDWKPYSDQVKALVFEHAGQAGLEILSAAERAAERMGLTTTSTECATCHGTEMVDVGSYYAPVVLPCPDCL